MKNKLIILFLLVVLVRISFGQINNTNLDFRLIDYNSLSVDFDLKIVIIGKANFVQLRADTSNFKLDGTHAYFNRETQSIYTFFNLNNSLSKLFEYGLDGKLKYFVELNGNISGITSPGDGQVLYIAINKLNDKGRKISSVLSYNIKTKELKEVFQPKSSILTSISYLGGDKLGLAGTIGNYIISTEGIVIKKIKAPHRSFGKTNSLKKQFLILQEYSDGSYLEIYESNGDSIRKIMFEHSQLPKYGTRRCNSCYTATASFMDFDLSPDGEYLIGLDQFKKVFLLNKNNELVREYESSSNWSFITFINDNEFIYLDKENDEIKKITCR